MKTTIQSARPIFLLLPFALAAFSCTAEGGGPLLGGSGGSLASGGTPASSGGASSMGGTVGNGGSVLGTGGTANVGTGGGSASGGTVAQGGAATGGKASGGTVAQGGAATGGKASGGTVAQGGAATGGKASGGTVAQGSAGRTDTSTGGTVATSSTGGIPVGGETALTGVEIPGENCTVPAMPALKDNAKLPDPFTMIDGSKVTTLAQWVCRHREISAMIQNFETGSKGMKKATVKGSVSGGSLTVSVSGGAAAVSFSVKITLPSTGTAPYPAMFGVDGGSLDNNKFLSMGIATVNLPTSIHPEGNRAGGAIAKFNGDSKSGQLIGLAWAMSRIIDALETTPDAKLDPKRLGITGCSRLGKAALMIGAMDSRIALTIPEDSGSGGVAAWRVSEADNNGQTGSAGVQNLSRTYSEAQWFSTSIEQFASSVNKLPVDHHELVAMVAPRGLLILSNTDYTWLGCNNADQAGGAAKMVYEALGAGKNIGYIDSGHTHCGTLPAAELSAIEAFSKKFLLGQESTATDVWKPKFALDKTKWVDWTAPASLK